MALQPIRHPHTRRADPLGCGSRPWHSLVRHRLRNGHHRCDKLSGRSDLSELLHRLLPGVEWRDCGDCHPGSEYQELCYWIWVSVLPDCQACFSATFTDRSYNRLTPWVSNMGLQSAFLVAAFAGLAQVLSFLIFVRYGRRSRQASEKRYHSYVEEMKAAGLVH